MGGFLVKEKQKRYITKKKKKKSVSSALSQKSSFPRSKIEKQNKHTKLTYKFENHWVSILAAKCANFIYIFP